MPASSRAAPGFGHRLKRWLFLIHRWVGIASCVLFAMWFVSGLVMAYVPFPALTKEEKLAGLPAIDWNLVRTSPGPGLRAAGDARPPRALSLEMRGAEPVWRITPEQGDEVAMSAASGKMLAAADRDEAQRVAEAFGRARAASVAQIERDQWTVAGGFDRHRPLWKVALEGSDGRVLYVSSTTGAVVQDTFARERFWNWLGSVPHWIYFTEIRKDGALWRQVVLWVSGPCMIAAFTGLWIGVLRTRLGKRRFKNGRVIPYRGWMEWHHVAGLVGGALLTTWIFSGWLSVDPGRLFESGGVGAAERAAFEGERLPPEIDLTRLAQAAQGAKQVELRWSVGRPLLLVNRARGTDVLDAGSLRPAIVDEAALLVGARGLVPGAAIASVERLTEPDLYWYDAKGKLPTLPVLRVRYDDPAGTWVHIDPGTGAILGDSDTRGRVYRWLYQLLHTWDINALTLNRPLWDIFVWFFSIAGIVTSITAIRVGWTRLTRPAARSSERRLTPATLEKDYA